MIRRFQITRPLYPLAGIAAAIIILVFGLVSAKSEKGFVYMGAVWLLFLCFGYWKSCLAVLPVAAAMSAFLAGVTWLISGDVVQTMAAVNRILAVCIAVIPGLAMPPAVAVRCFSSLKLPRVLTLAMMITLTFFSLLGAEVRQVREAMRTRGAGSLFSPKIAYRAFLIPLVMRLTNISDTLALSVETRGFTPEDKDATVYKTVKPGVKDGMFLPLLLAACVWVIV